MNKKFEEFILNNLDKPWDWVYLARDQVYKTENLYTYLVDPRGITRPKIERYPVSLEFVKSISNPPWTHELSSFPMLTENYITKHLYENWDFIALSRNPSINPDFVIKNPQLPWVWGDDGLSSNPNTTVELIELFKDNPWYFRSLSTNVNLTHKFILKNINEDWCWNNLSGNPCITPEFVEKHQDLPWVWGAYSLSSNVSITPEFIERNIDKDWVWGKFGLSRNPRITLDFITKHIDKPWDWGRYGLSSNLFTYELNKKF